MAGNLRYKMFSVGKVNMNNQKTVLIVFALLLTGILTDNIFAKQTSEEYANKDFKQNLGGETETEEFKKQIEQLKVENNKLKKQVDDKKEKEANDYYFKVWKSYEDVAMHFNDLIIRLRIQSIGGIAAIAAILGIFLQKDDGKNKIFKCILATVSLFFLLICWSAIEKLDLQYYDRLLEGSVNAILELENDKEAFLDDSHIDLSVNIEKAFRVSFNHECPDKVILKKNETARLFVDGRRKFYNYVKCGLWMLLFLSVCLCIWRIWQNKKPKEG